MTKHPDMDLRVCQYTLYFMPDPTVPRTSWWTTSREWDIPGYGKQQIVQVVPNEYGHTSDCSTSDEYMIDSDCDCPVTYEAFDDGVVIVHNRFPKDDDE